MGDMVETELKLPTLNLLLFQHTIFKMFKYVWLFPELSFPISRDCYEAQLRM